MWVGPFGHLDTWEKMRRLKPKCVSCLGEHQPLMNGQDRVHVCCIGTCTDGILENFHECLMAFYLRGAKAHHSMSLRGPS